MGGGVGGGCAVRGRDGMLRDLWVVGLTPGRSRTTLSGGLSSFGKIRHLALSHNDPNGRYLSRWLGQNWARRPLVHVV